MTEYVIINQWTSADGESLGQSAHFDYNAAYAKVIEELEQAIKTTKSQKLRDIIADCIQRLQQLQEFSDSVVKQCFQMQEQIGQQQEALQQAQAQAEQAQAQAEQARMLIPFQVYPDASEETYFEPTATSPATGELTTQEDHGQEQEQQDLIVQKESSISPKKEPGTSRRGTKRQLPATRGSKKKDLQEKENREEGEILNPSFESIPIDKEKLVKESQQAAQDHDFGDLTHRYTRQAILDMVESSARESVRNFLVHGMLEQVNAPDSKRPSYMCKEPGCGLDFSNHLGALGHCLRAHLNAFKPCACDKCDKRFYLKIDLRYHQSAHTNVYRLHCPHEGCKFRCNKKADLRAHLPTHNTEKQCVCDICGKAIANERKLVKHKKFHSPGQFPCDWPGCAAVLSTKFVLYEHKKRHEALATQRYKCQFCDYFSSRASLLKRHLKGKHNFPEPLTPEERAKPYMSKRMPVTCTKCGKSVKKHSIKYHMKVCGTKRTTTRPSVSVPKQPMTCPYCSKTISKFSFAKHMKQYHSQHPASVIPPPHRDMVTCSVCSCQINSKSFKAHFTKHHPTLDYYPARAIKPERPTEEAGSEQIQDTTDTNLDELSESIMGPEGFSEEEDVSDAEAEGIIDSDLEEQEDSKVLIKSLKDKRRRISAFRSSLNTTSDSSTHK